MFREYYQSQIKNPLLQLSATVSFIYTCIYTGSCRSRPHGFYPKHPRSDFTNLTIYVPKYKEQLKSLEVIQVY